MLWVALAILFVNGEPSGSKILAAPTEVACKALRAAEASAMAGSDLWIGQCQEAKTKKDGK